MLISGNLHHYSVPGNRDDNSDISEKKALLYLFWLWSSTEIDMLH